MGSLEDDWADLRQDWHPPNPDDVPPDQIRVGILWFGLLYKERELLIDRVPVIDRAPVDGLNKYHHIFKLPESTRVDGAGLWLIKQGNAPLYLKRFPEVRPFVSDELKVAITITDTVTSNSGVTWNRVLQAIGIRV